MTPQELQSIKDDLGWCPQAPAPNAEAVETLVISLMKIIDHLKETA